MSTTKKLSNITAKQITDRGIQALANRPNASAQYGVGGLSPTQLKLWFDKLATFIAEKINELQNTISADDAATYIRLLLDEYGVENLNDLVKSFENGTFAERILRVLPSANAFARVSLQQFINDMALLVSENAECIADLDQNKLNKVTDSAKYRRAYIIDTDGTQKVIYISDTPLSGGIPIFVGEGQIAVAVPVDNIHAANKGYVDQQDRFLGSTVEISIDKSTYIMTLRLKNTAGSILSTATVDLPLESTVIGGSYDNGKLTLSLMGGTSVKIDVSDIIDGLVNTSTYIKDLTALNTRIDDTNAILHVFKKEVDQKEIYAHSAFYAVESESARNYTKGGNIDRELRAIKKRLSGLEHGTT